ncbi:hypothetical protein TH25_09580 [Thalassospira profundimaris]|uniref:Inner membrane protein n=1 Tax=Thalassospira profundimaris TaxID=502049 RepID=A0A367XCB6_9PROT|nr:YqiJ family protein [Thalassospira profundimaris]RCK51217.1 hypothetical protein TH25_09580 [Thalassospira profundimaris]
MFLSYLNETSNFPFSVSLVIVAILALIEGIGLIIGAGIFGFLDGLLPDIDLDIDVPDMTAPSIGGQFLTWLQIGRIPAIFSLIVFLVAFGLIGLFLQGMVAAVLGAPLPALLACIPALVLSMPVLSVGNRALAAIIPRDETSAVSHDSLIGKPAVITGGEARKDYPAQGKLKDQYRQTHYILIEPDNDQDIFAQGQKVLLVRRHKSIYFAIPIESDGLID